MRKGGEGWIGIGIKYSTMFAIFSVMFIAETMARARSAGGAVVLQTRFEVSSAGPLMQSGNCMLQTGDASTAIAAADAIARILKLGLIIAIGNKALVDSARG